VLLCIGKVEAGSGFEDPSELGRLDIDIHTFAALLGKVAIDPVCLLAHGLADAEHEES